MDDQELDSRGQYRRDLLRGAVTAWRGTAISN
jgi:hypothetical protein